MLAAHLKAPPITPPSGPTQRLFQEPPAKSKFLAIGLTLGVNAGMADDPNGDGQGRGDLDTLKKLHPPSSQILCTRQQDQNQTLEPETHRLPAPRAK